MSEDHVRVCLYMHMHVHELASDLLSQGLQRCCQTDAARQCRSSQQPRQLQGVTIAVRRFQATPRLVL